MSMMRQLWLAVIVSTITAFAGSMLVSIWSAQGYLTKQIERKNGDVASSLALSMTQQNKDPVTIELQITALFDTGYYQAISVADPFGKIISQRIQDKSEAEVPGWFTKSFPITSNPGLAQISDGWKQYGTVIVISHTQFAYKALWEQAVKLLLWFCLGGSCVGILGMLVLRTIGRSFNDVVKQAGAIGERRFITITEPNIPELRTLTRAMNGMVERLKEIFKDSAVRLDELLRSANYDQLTGLPNRDYFMAYLKSQIIDQESPQTGVLVLLRLTDLNKTNETLGRVSTDKLLREMGQIINDFTCQHEGAMAGRIKAGDIALLFPGEKDPRGVSHRMEKMFDTELFSHRSDLTDIFHLGVIQFDHGCHFSDILSRADHALAMAERQGSNAIHVLERNEQENAIPSEQWRVLLSHAVKAGRLKLEFYPVQKITGKTLHQEGMARLFLESGKQLTASDFIPIAEHLNMTTLVDLAMVRLALAHLSTNPDDVAINLSTESIGNWTFRAEFLKLLRNNLTLCPRLCFEVSEYGAFKNFEAFKDICLEVKRLGCHMGIEQFGQRLSESHKLTELGLDYVKIHPGLMRNIEDNTANQEFLKYFCGVAHAVGVIVIAVGVRSEDEQVILKSLGIDGITGSKNGG